MDEAARARLVANIAGRLSQASRDEIFEWSVAYFRQADGEYGQRVAEAVVALRGSQWSEASRRPKQTTSEVR